MKTIHETLLELPYVGPIEDLVEVLETLDCANPYMTCIKHGLVTVDVKQGLYILKGYHHLADTFDASDVFSLQDAFEHFGCCEMSADKFVEDYTGVGSHMYLDRRTSHEDFSGGQKLALAVTVTGLPKFFPIKSVELRVGKDLARYAMEWLLNPEYNDDTDKVVWSIGVTKIVPKL